MTKKELWDQFFNDKDLPDNKTIECSICKKIYNDLLEFPIKDFLGNTTTNFICRNCFIGLNDDLRDLLENFLISDAISEEDKNRIEKILGDNNG